MAPERRITRVEVTDLCHSDSRCRLQDALWKVSMQAWTVDIRGVREERALVGCCAQVGREPVRPTTDHSLVLFPGAAFPAGEAGALWHPDDVAAGLHVNNSVCLFLFCAFSQRGWVCLSPKSAAGPLRGVS